MTYAPTADPVAARTALAEVAGRLTGLLRSSTQPTAHAVGEWDVADVAVHLGNAWDILPALARRERSSLLDDVWELGALTTSLTRSATERDLGAIADRIDAAAVSFLELAAEGNGGTAPWLVRGIEMPLVTFVCHLLSESMVHGWDIARAQGRSWRVEPAHARLVFEGFLFPVLSALPPTAMVEPDAVAGLNATYDLAVRRGPRMHLRFAGGAVYMEPPGSGRVDCHVSADPAVLLLLMFGRVNQTGAILRGQLLAWGRRPWLGPRLRRLLRNP